MAGINVQMLRVMKAVSRDCLKILVCVSGKTDVSALPLDQRAQTPSPEALGRAFPPRESELITATRAAGSASVPPHQGSRFTRTLLRKFLELSKLAVEQRILKCKDFT